MYVIFPGLFLCAKGTTLHFSVFLDVIDQIERTVQISVPISAISPDEARDPGGDHANIHPLKETRAALEKLVSRMESLGSEFDKLVERSGQNL
jgi:hypothetical protein